MLRLVLALEFFLVFPFLCLAAGLRSGRLAVGFAVIGLDCIAYFLRQSRALFLKSMRATPLPSDSLLAPVFDRLVQSHGKKINAALWLIPSADSQLQIWVQSSGKMDFCFTQGMVSQLTEKELERVILADRDLTGIRISNRLYALSLVMERLKGPFGRFRYWQVSFWVYPLEQFLKVARI